LRHLSDDTHIMHLESVLVKQRRWHPGHRRLRNVYDILLELAEQAEAASQDMPLINLCRWA